MLDIRSAKFMRSELSLPYIFFSFENIAKTAVSDPLPYILHLAMVSVKI